MEERSFLSNDRTNRALLGSNCVLGGLRVSFGAAPIFLVLLQPPVKNFYRWQEVVSLNHQQVDVVEVLAAAEAVGKIVAGIDGHTQFVAVGTLKSKIVIALF